MNAPVLTLALKSLLNRHLTAILTALAVAASVTLFVGVEKIREGTRAGFESTISDTDLIVGARSGAVNLLLYSVFRLGDPTSNISWESFERISEAPAVEWTIPISLGDSHRGYRVMGTSGAYFDHFRFGRGTELTFDDGAAFSGVFQVVLGAEVASALGYRLGDEIIVAHGVGRVSFMEHAGSPFRVVGILERTGTPVDRTVHVPLEGIEAIHIGWESGAPPSRRQEITIEDRLAADLTPDEITAFLVAVESPIQILRLQRQINTYEEEALSAIIPGVALSQLWGVISIAERALIAISMFVILVGLISVLTSISTSVNERRREMAILRAVGARPWHIFSLLVVEAGALAFAGALTGIVFVNIALLFVSGALQDRFGLVLETARLGWTDLAVVVAVPAAGALMGALPAWRALQNSLADGLSIRL